jgi:hypothetical protein
MPPGSRNGRRGRFLADTLAGLVPDVDVSECACIGFSGDNDAVGHTYFAVLAR